MSESLIENNTLLPITYWPSSSTHQLSKFNWALSYKDISNVSGSQVYLDTIRLGPGTLYSYPNQSVLIADTASPELP
jgi:hypothetical protein